MWITMWIMCRYFNSQPHKEADKDNMLQSKGYSDFNSQPHKEADGNFIQ